MRSRRPLTLARPDCGRKMLSMTSHTSSGQPNEGVAKVADGWLLPLAGLFVGPITVGLTDITLKLSRFRSGGGPDRPTLSMLRFLYSDAENQQIELSRDQWKDHGDKAPLTQKLIDTALARHDGSLAVMFADGTRLEVPFADVEAWELKGPGQLFVVSPAGGGDPAIF